MPIITKVLSGCPGRSCPFSSIFCCSATKSCPTLCNPGLQHTRLPCLSPSPRVCSNSRPLSWWCHPIISSSVALFSSCLQPFLASGSFPVSWLLPSGGQSIGASASALVLPMNIQGWFSLELTSLISLLSKGLSRVFSNTTIQKHQLFGAQPSLWSNSHIYTWLLKNHSFYYTDHCWQSDACKPIKSPHGACGSLWLPPNTY